MVDNGAAALGGDDGVNVVLARVASQNQRQSGGRSSKLMATFSICFRDRERESDFQKTTVRQPPCMGSSLKNLF
jgi:hypothetical protein